MSIFIRVEHLLPVHPLTHGQVLGAEHLRFIPHEGLQIAKLSYHKAQYINNTSYADNLEKVHNHQYIHTC